MLTKCDSKDAVYDNKKAIRGGIPVVFRELHIHSVIHVLMYFIACFGAWDLGPQHGFARSTAWELHSGPEKVYSLHYCVPLIAIMHEL